MIHSNENRLHTGSLSLLTDLYQLTMAYGYWKQGIADPLQCSHAIFGP